MWSGWDYFVCHVISYNAPSFLRLFTDLTLPSWRRAITAFETSHPGHQRKGSDACRKVLLTRDQALWRLGQVLAIEGRETPLWREHHGEMVGHVVKPTLSPRTAGYTTLIWAPLPDTCQDVKRGPSKQWAWSGERGWAFKWAFKGTALGRALWLIL